MSNLRLVLGMVLGAVFGMSAPVSAKTELPFYYKLPAKEFYVGSVVHWRPTFSRDRKDGVHCSWSGGILGLQLNPRTCEITGILFQPQPGAFEILVHNTLGAPVPVRFNTVHSRIVFPATSLTVYRQQWLNLAPTVLGPWPSPQCRISGYPGALTINPVTCAISGPVLFPLGETVLRIESYASAGPVELRLNVIDSEIRYPSETITLYRRHWFQIAPVAVLGQWTSPNCSMSVHHPMISIDPVTCIISGLAELSPGEHVLQVHSWASAPPAEVRIRVLEAEIDYGATEFTVRRGQPVQWIPQFTGPAQPAYCQFGSDGLGLQLDPATCAITGVTYYPNGTYDIYIHSQYDSTGTALRVHVVE